MKSEETKKIVNDFFIALNNPMKAAKKYNKPVTYEKEDISDANIEYIQDDSEKLEESFEEEDVGNKSLDVSENPQGVIDSIAQELTPVRLQQAIILSEIVGKPRSKTRKRRRF